MFETRELKSLLLTGSRGISILSLFRNPDDIEVGLD
jgi:hypothetical protein